MVLILSLGQTLTSASKGERRFLALLGWLSRVGWSEPSELQSAPTGREKPDRGGRMRPLRVPEPVAGPARGRFAHSAAREASPARRRA